VPELRSCDGKAGRAFGRAVVSFWLGGCLLAACGSETRPVVPSMAFEVDPRRLGAPIEALELGLRFQPPLAWEQLATSDVDSVDRALGEGPVGFTPRYVFLDSTNGSLLSVATMHFADSLTFDERVVYFGNLLADRFPGDTLRQGQYLKDNIHIAQYLLEPPGLVIFKLLFESSLHETLQFDYIVPRAEYPGQIKAIESSIGSIALLR